MSAFTSKLRACLQCFAVRTAIFAVTSHHAATASMGAAVFFLVIHYLILSNYDVIRVQYVGFETAGTAGLSENLQACKR